MSSRPSPRDFDESDKEKDLGKGHEAKRPQIPKDEDLDLVNPDLEKDEDMEDAQSPTRLYDEAIPRPPHEVSRGTSEVVASIRSIRSQRTYELSRFAGDANRSEASGLRAQSEAEMGHVPGALCDELEQSPPESAGAWGSKRQSRRFQVNICKKGKQLGLRYDDTDGLALVISNIDPGVFYDSMMELSSDQWAMPDDCIIEVNGVRGNRERLEEQCMNSDVLSMTLERLLPPPNQRIFCQNSDPTVIVHAYDLFGHGKGILSCMARTVNSVSTRFGLFHTGVEVFGNEWFFGASLEGLFHGVNCATPKQHPVHRYRTSVALGSTKITPDGFEEIMPLIRMKWPAWTYNPISRNCHTFTDFFCHVLGFQSVPKFGLFSRAPKDAPGASLADMRSLVPCGACPSLLTSEGRVMPVSPRSGASCVRFEQ